MWHHTSVTYKASNTWHTCGVTSVWDMWANMWHLILSHIWHLTCVSDMCVTCIWTHICVICSTYRMMCVRHMPLHVTWCDQHIFELTLVLHDCVRSHYVVHVLVTHMVVYVWYMMIHMFSYRASAHVCGNLYVTHNLYVVHDWHTSHMCDTTDTCMRPHVWQKWVTNMFKHVQYILFVCHMCALLCMSHVWLLHVCIRLA